jgi:Fe-S cluster assembly iron-binding protein IscA
LAIIVTDIDPEVGELLDVILETGAAHELAEAIQKENTFEKPSIRVTLTTTGRATPAPEKTFTATDDEDDHLVEDAEVPDIRDATDESNN